MFPIRLPQLLVVVFLATSISSCKDSKKMEIKKIEILWTEAIEKIMVNKIRDGRCSQHVLQSGLESDE